MALSPVVIQAAQVLTVAVFAPFVSGVLAKIEALGQGRRGPRVLQPYYDLVKLLRKEILVPEPASWVFLVAPALAVACFLTVPILIPVLTSYPLPLGIMGDILAGGFVLSLGGFALALGSAETGSPYPQLGSSRAMTFGALIEPAILFVTFTVALTTGTDLPYAEGDAVRASLAQALSPAHVLVMVAFFLVVLNDTGRIPVETHASTLELGMIDEARTMEWSGPLLALVRFGSMVKQFVLYVILIDVFTAPWGLAGSRSPGAIGLAVVALIGKALAVGTVFTLIDNSFSKLRLFKLTEFMAAVFLLAVLAVMVDLAGLG
ncbi:respiratory chain complex I subunit 1 family protein [Aciditerrimonas ferrireducens]|uniref:respiratory chain complex I subunit 1 family protein n=1 Tax=Aciditerrimonas ferrireducens TaxID=667306 RepID=UPI0020060B49|nr:NADH-quinone oxidoreductase subunit H [Aciditerrimonas ferrireducens]MCK4176663.1 NADH-quinone oxidoreductase subunit H [Aciditerrimonas ferrireducens]